MKLKRIFATTIALIATSPLFANVCNPCCEYDCYEPCDSYCEPGCGWDCCDYLCKWSAHADWIYWKVRRDGLDYAIKGRQPPATGETLNGSIRSIDPHYSSGFRVGVYGECGDCWRYGLRYTSFEIEEDKSISVSGSPQVNFRGTRMTAETDIGPLQSASANYKFDLDIIDLETYYIYNLDCSCAVLRPFTGIRLAYIDQDLDTVYVTTIEGTAITRNVYDVINMDAYGLSFGLEAEWDNLFCNLGLYGRFVGVLSLGEFEISHLELNPTAAIVDVKHHTYWVVPSWEIAFGLNYQLNYFLCACWDVTLGYEFHSWCNIPDYLNFPDSFAEGLRTRGGTDLSYDGLFLRLNATF